MRINRHYSAPACASLLIAAAILLSGCSSEHPSDRSLLDNFRLHKAEFERLLQMFRADKGLGRVAYDFTRPENPRDVGVSRERLREYRDLFGELGLSAGVEGYGEKEVIWFHASTRGLSVTGSSKGY